VEPVRETVLGRLRQGWHEGRRRHGALGLRFAWFARYVLVAAQHEQAAQRHRGREAALVETLARMDLADLYLTGACDAALAAAWIHLTRVLLPQVEEVLRREGADPELAHTVAFELPGRLHLAHALRDGTLSLAHYHGRGGLLAWLRRVARSQLRDRLRGRRRRQRRQARTLRERPRTAWLPRDEGATAAAAGASRAVLRALASMTTRERAFFGLHAHRHAPQEEVARRLGLSLRTVTRVQASVYGRLRSCLASEGLALVDGPANRGLAQIVARQIAAAAQGIDLLSPPTPAP
jgi:RNA polymerase sigma factor (sigma-70 family)